MGSGQSLPPGEALYIQEPACCSGFKFKFSFECQSKPASLGGVPSDKWSAFQTAVDGEARQIINNEMIWLIIIPFIVISHFAEGISSMIISVLGVGVVWGASVFLTNKNKERDQSIRNLCSQFSAETGVMLEYFTAHTGVCKPKGARIVRAIIVQGGGAATIGSIAMTGTTLMSVQVPPGAQSGQTVQIQTASGPMNVVVPQGLAAGETFQVQVPAAPVPVVQATPVQATPLPTVQATAVTSPASVHPKVDEDNPNMEEAGKATSQSAKIPEAN
eukprot:gnl/MRDRNA2_/MRDRNA2_120911_c0_seq1.p1 gnl/MRDRNA2_/MRDRNA2_120911_c0~~gnl/MRDRNA2_/MRDRNA2_120911_c0_seq1.p1  ORF type:complete len:274 (-),score=41.91 gnl/MRDRNA2_/MRDRNA2_120911_c0_seq1:167-988(-)